MSKCIEKSLHTVSCPSECVELSLYDHYSLCHSRQICTMICPEVIIFSIPKSYI